MNILIWSYRVRYSLSKTTCFAGNGMPSKPLNTSLLSYIRKLSWWAKIKAKIDKHVAGINIVKVFISDIFLILLGFLGVRFWGGFGGKITK